MLRTGVADLAKLRPVLFKLKTKEIKGFDKLHQTNFDKKCVDIKNVNNSIFTPLRCNSLSNPIPVICPTHEKPIKVYSFPTPDKVIMEAPTVLNNLIEKVEPFQPLIPIQDPINSAVTTMIAGPRMLTIRRKKMKKHKRKKRFDRDYFKYQKHHRQKKIKAEKLFRQRMNELMNSLETFDPLDYVKSTITRAKREWNHNLAPSGKKKYPHWSELMTLEELYGIEKDDYIDKRAGLPDEETKQIIAQKRKEYLLKYSLNPKSTPESK